MNSLGSPNSGSGRNNDMLYTMVMAGVLVLSAMAGAGIGFIIDLAAPDEAPTQAAAETPEG